MADTAATDDQGEAAPKGASALKFASVLVVLTILGMGAGAPLGLKLAASVEDVVRDKAESEKSVPIASRYTGATHLKELAPIVTNLGDPSSVWVRLQGSLVLDEAAVEDADLLAGEISEDLLAYLRTVSLAQIEGPSGFQHLREDLDERVAIRSQGRVRELVVQTLVVQ